MGNNLESGHLPGTHIRVNGHLGASKDIPNCHQIVKAEALEIPHHSGAEYEMPLLPGM